MDLISRQSTALVLDVDTAQSDNKQVEAPAYDLADLLLDYLSQLGVSHVFGIPGGAIEPLFNALARNEKKKGGIKTIVSRHETGAAFM